MLGVKGKGNLRDSYLTHLSSRGELPDAHSSLRRFNCFSPAFRRLRRDGPPTPDRLLGYNGAALPRAALQYLGRDDSFPARSLLTRKRGPAWLLLSRTG